MMMVTRVRAVAEASCPAEGAARAAQTRARVVATVPE